MIKKLQTILFLLNHGLEYIDSQARRIDVLEATYIPRPVPIKKYSSLELEGTLNEGFKYPSTHEVR